MLNICRKFKIPDYQSGHVYLTSHRICYVDNENPRKNSTAIDLKDIERVEFYVGVPKTWVESLANVIDRQAFLDLQQR